MRRREFLAYGAAALGSSLAATTGCKHSLVSGGDDVQSWPRRPITIMVPFDVGGAADRLHGLGR